MRYITVCELCDVTGTYLLVCATSHNSHLIILCSFRVALLTTYTKVTNKFYKTTKTNRYLNLTSGQVTWTISRTIHRFLIWHLISKLIENVALSSIRSQWKQGNGYVPRRTTRNPIILLIGQVCPEDQKYYSNKFN